MFKNISYFPIGSSSQGSKFCLGDVSVSPKTHAAVSFQICDGIGENFGNIRKHFET